MAAATSHARLRGTPSGGACALTGGRLAHSPGYQARSDVPPKDAAAAEISTSSSPCGLSRPAATKVASFEVYKVAKQGEAPDASLPLLGPRPEERLQRRHQTLRGQPPSP